MNPKPRRGHLHPSFKNTARLLLGLTLPALLLVPSRAEFLNPVAIAFASAGEDTAPNLIDDFQLSDPTSPDAIHDPAGASWSAVGSIRAEVVFDLGQTVDLTKAYIWNYQADTTAGAKEIEIQVSPDEDYATARFTGIARVSLTEGGDTAQTFDIVATGARLVRLRILANWGQGFTVGLSAVRFEAEDIEGNVPAVVLNSPTQGSTVAVGSSLEISADVEDADNDIEKVEFFDGATLLGTLMAPPWSFTASQGFTFGEHEIRVVATDRSGKVGWASATISAREETGATIIQIDDEADIGDGINQIQYSDGWTLAPGNESDPRFMHNDHYSSTRGAYFEVRFVGIRIDIYATVAGHHGLATARIDDGEEVDINYQADQRAEQQFIWSSPILPNREHVLRVTVKGTAVVTADRFDVHVPADTGPDLAGVSRTAAKPGSIEIDFKDFGESVVVPESLELTVDGQAVTAAVSKTGDTTTVVYAPAGGFQPGSAHTYEIAGRDTNGNALASQGTFTTPSPPFPLGGLGGPKGSAGEWGLRTVWNAGIINSLSSAVDAAARANTAGFTGEIHEATVPMINLGESTNPDFAGLFFDDIPLPAESEGLTPSDFVVIGHAYVNVPETGDWTIGVHSDEGFGLRFVGGAFGSVSGAGLRDDFYPEYMFNPNNTTDSNSRGILTNLAAGVYEIQFIGYERTGSAHFEIYAVNGAFAEDFDTADWRLIGEPGGLELVDGPPEPLSIASIAFSSGNIVINFSSPDAPSAHELQESDDLRTWQPAAGATFGAGQNNLHQVTVTGPSAPMKFYRLRASSSP